MLPKLVTPLPTTLEGEKMMECNWIFAFSDIHNLHLHFFFSSFVDMDGCGRLGLIHWQINHLSNGVWLFFFFAWYKANPVQMISACRKRWRFASFLPHSPPEVILVSLHAQTLTRTPPFFPHNAAGVCLYLSYWLMKQAQQGIRER